MTKRAERGGLIVGLDVGTSKIAAIVGEVGSHGEVDIVGFGTHPSRGLKKGVVVNIEATVQSIKRAVEEAELMAGCRIQSVYAGISGSHIRSLNSNGIVAVRNREVTQQDVERVIDAACAVAIPADQELLHVLPQEFIVDDQGGITEPVGMSGVRLEVRVHMITGSVSAAQNIKKCIERCGLTADKLILEQLASSYAVLLEDEKELGVCLVDIGGGTTDIAVFEHGAIRHTDVIPIGGEHVSNDIAVALRAPPKHADDIKIKFGCALPELIEGEEMIDVSEVGDRPNRSMSKHVLTEVIRARMDELFRLVLREVRRGGFDTMPAGGVVLTGGSSQIHGAVELAEEIFEVPVRLGLPVDVTGMSEIAGNPGHATGVGLLRYGVQSQPQVPGKIGDSGFAQMLARMKSWFTGSF